MKKICFITTVSITLKTFVLPVAKYLHERTDWDITFICNNDEKFACDLPEYIRYIPIPMERGISLSGVSAMLQMVKIFREEKFDLVQYSTPNASLYASLAAWIARVPHRKYHLMGFRYLGMAGISRTIFKIVETLTCSLSTDIECVSKSNLDLGVSEHIFSFQKSNILFHGSSSGVDLRRFDISKKHIWRSKLREQFGYSNHDCVFGFAGRITKDKGINELLGAFSALRGTNQRLFLVGNIENEKSLDPALLSQAQADEKITWHPHVENIEQYYAMMDVLVLPSYREGFGNIVIEAEAMGVPVIVTDIPGPTDAMAANQTGLVVKKADPDDLRNAMETMLHSEELRARFGEEAHRFAVENFEQNKLCEEILKDRKRLLGE